MKPKQLLPCLLALLGSITAHAYDIEMNGVYYCITDATAKTLEVTYVEDGEGNADFYYGSVIIPKRISKNGITYTVTSIGGHAFENCSGLTSLTIPDGVTSIGNWTFSGCSGLTSLTIPEGVTIIGSSAFEGCSSLTNITIPNSVTSIGSYAFSGCTNLTSVSMPASIVFFSGFSAFGDENNIEAVYITDLEKWLGTSFSLGNNPLHSGARLYLNGEELTELVIPDGISAILTAAFRGCESLVTVVIPETVTSIGSTAFHGCSGLTSVTIPNSVTSIGGHAFSSCSSLTSVYVKMETPPAITESVFSNRAKATLYVPYGCSEAYEAAAYWQDFTIVEIGDPELEQGEFVYTPQGCFQITGANLNANNAFQNMNGWTAIGEGKTLADLFITNADGLAAGMNSVTSTAATAGEGMYFKFEPTDASAAYVVSFKMKGAALDNIRTRIPGDGYRTEANLVKVAGNDANVYTHPATEGEVIVNTAEELNENWQTFNYAIQGDGTARTWFISFTAMATTIEIADLQIAPAMQFADLRQRDAMLEKLNTFKSCYEWPAEVLEEYAITEAIENLNAIGDETGQAELDEQLVTAQEILDEFINANMDDYLPTVEVTATTYGQGSPKVDVKFKQWFAAVRKAYTWGDWNCLPSGRGFWEQEAWGATEFGRYAGNTAWNFGDVDSPMGVYMTKTLDPGSYVFGIESRAALREDPTSSSWTNNEGWKPAYGVAYIVKMENEVATDTIASVVKDLDAVNYTTFNVPVTIQEAGSYEIGYKAYCKDAYKDLKNGSAVYLKNAYIWGKNTIGEEENNEIEVTDISQMDNVIYINKVEARAGTMATLSVKMKNSFLVEGFGFDLVLPEGVTVALDDYGDPMAELSTERTNSSITNHFDVDFKLDGSLNIQAYSTKGRTISGKDGEVALITIKVSENMPAGEYPIVLKNIAISDENSSTVTVESVTSLLEVPAYKIGDANNDGNVNVGDLTAISHYILERPDASFLFQAADANQDGNVNVGDLTAVSHLILWGSIVRPQESAPRVSNIIDPQ